MYLFLTIILSLQIVFMTIFAYAQEEEKAVVTTVKKGQPAPFTGTLLNPSAVAKIIAENQKKEEYCKEMTSYLSMRDKTDCALKKDMLKAEYDSYKNKTNEILKIKNAEILSLQKAVENKSSGFNWKAVAGIVLGVVAIAGTVVLVTRVSEAAINRQ